jgi:hypothetical protein
MANLAKDLDHLLKQGAERFHPDGKAPLVFAWADEHWSQLLALTLEDSRLREQRYSLHAADYDEATGKLYAAYSATDYLQIRALPFEQIKEHRQLLEQHYLQLTQEQLPAQARKSHWAITEGHCLQRVVLDALFQDCWYNHLSKSRPAYQQLNNLQLGRALLLCSRIGQTGRPLVAWLNVSSLTFRGKKQSEARSET